MVNYDLNQFMDPIQYSQFSQYVLGIDIGGTQTNCAIAGTDTGTPQLLFSLTFKTQHLDSVHPAIKKTLRYAKDHHDIRVSSAGIGAAGIVSPQHDYATLTNVSWNLSSDEVLKATSLSRVHIINDFQALGFGINFLSEKNATDLHIIRARDSETSDRRLPRALLGAGTGLGKSLLIYDDQKQLFIPQSSEGGHADIPVHSLQELELLQYIQTEYQITEPITYEELLSGRGIEHIYQYLYRQDQSNTSTLHDEILNSIDKPAVISQHRATDPLCRHTFDLFTKIYARCAKNFVLDTMAQGGLYIAGGIAIKNPDIFSSDVFINEFHHAYRRQDMLHTIPIFLVENYDVSLYGACFAAIP